ncbi:MAG: hypothetical protein LAT63_03210 [Marinobacter sp.]|nr:hypothetical protein [Marinobacter sp.]
MTAPEQVINEPNPANRRTDAEPQPDQASEAPPAAVVNPYAGAADEQTVAAYWAERRRYVGQIRKEPELRQRFWRAVAIYILRRTLWSFGFFPVFIVFWVPLVMANFDPVILATNSLSLLNTFVYANPEVQANMVNTLLVAWLSMGFFFLVFDFVLTPFRSPYQYEADVHMRAWEKRYQDKRKNRTGNHSGTDEPAKIDQGPTKV